MIATRCWWFSLLNVPSWILKLFPVRLDPILPPKIDLSTTRASQQTETSKDLHLPKLYPNQIHPIIPSHPTMPRGYSLHLPWPVRTKKSAAGSIFQWAGLTFGEVFPTRNTPGAWLVRTAKQKGSQMEHTSKVSWYFLNSPEWRILRRPPKGCRCRWFWSVTRVMLPNQATCTMYKMPILTTGLKAPPLVLRDKMGRFLTFMLYGWTMSHFTFHTVQSVWLRPPSGVHFFLWWRSLLP